MAAPTIISGRYKVIKELGSGGFGVTFLAEDTHLPSQRICVVKKLKPIVQNQAIAQLVKERFQREAVVLEELGSHPQIPQLFAYFEEDQEFYLVQEYVEGQTLEDLVQQTGFQPEATVKQILADLLNILEFIQTKKIIHRDIKPENIILRASDRQPTLIDFGAVREIMGTQIIASGSATSSIVIGTPGFMPAEQASGRPVYASDLYALALTMIYLLTGHYPQNFAHDPLTGELDWHSQRNITPNFTALLNRAIQTNQKERFPTATAMKKALLDLSSAQRHTASTVVSPALRPTDQVTLPTLPVEKPAKLVRLWLGLVSFGVLSFVGGFGYLQLRPMQVRNDAQFEQIQNSNSEEIILSDEVTTTAIAEPPEASEELVEPNVSPSASTNSSSSLAPTNTTTSVNDSQNQVQNQNLAVVFDPPSNVRESPNGRILCSVKNQATISIYESNGDWHQTDVCGATGVIHISQIRWQNSQPTAIAPQLSEIGVALVFDPPSNVRDSPNGNILCAVEAETHINIFNSSGEWFETDFCGTMGVIHSSQLTFQN